MSNNKVNYKKEIKVQYYHSISSKELRRQISRHKSLSNKSFSLNNYHKQQKLEEHIEKVIDSFEEGELKLDPSQYALFAKYIYAVTASEGLRERLFTRLQKMADFDVRAEAKRANLTFFEKLFNIDPSAIPYLSTSKMQKRIKAYQGVHRYFAKSPIRNHKMYQKGEKLYHEAQKYMQAFLDGKITIKPEDRETFVRYVKVFEYPLYKGSTGQQCLDKLKTLPEEYVEEKKSFKEKFNIWLARFHAPKSKAKPQIKQNRHNYIKAASVALILACGSALAYIGLTNNSDKEDVNKDKNKTEKLITPPSSNQKQSASPAKMATWDKEKMDIFKDTMFIPKCKVSPNRVTPKSQKTEDVKAKQVQPAVTKRAQPIENVVKTKSVTPIKSKIEEYTVSEKQAIINHHNHVIEMRLGEKQAQKLDEKIENLRTSGIISLSKEISNAEIAYAFVMYRAYGVQSSLKDALNSQVKLTAEQNNKLLEDIKAVGSTGDGVKKMAEIQHKDRGELNHDSCYDHASYKDKKQHAKNLKQLRQLQKAKQRVA